MNIYSNVENLKGVGPKTLCNLNKCCIFNILDLILYFPRNYNCISNLNSLPSGKNRAILKCMVKSIKKDIRTKTGKVMSTIVFESGRDVFYGKWFNQPYMKKKFRIGMKYMIMGRFQSYRGESTIVNPVIVNEKGDTEIKEKIIPVYPLREGLTNNFFIKLIGQVLDQIEISENLPEYVLNKYKFCSLDEAIRKIHRPAKMDDLKEAKRRLKFQELFTYSMKIFTLKEYYNVNKKGMAFKISKELVNLKEGLPYKLTQSQRKVIREILIDEKKKIPMNRLVQGDVGSGKTIVAFIAMFNVIKNGYQAVLMAPTEILAKQHYEEASSLLKKFNIKIDILCGSTSKKNKESIKKRIKDGAVDLVIGTHALIEDNVVFNKLGIAVTDEQHRFGVMQRSKLSNKSSNIDVLVMTATPIPRTLSLYLYGDLEVSTIEGLPPGRKKVKTYYVNKSSRDRVYRYAVEEIKKGRQIYVVCPLVEDNENFNLSSVENIQGELNKKYFSNVSTEILYGNMPGKLKQDIMERFKNGEIKVMISTTVIEVGINVPNASLMIIENAERFGLAQLHQLRGRVGRGKYESSCILVADIRNDAVRRKMEIMKRSNDGFFIAEEDLKIRGAGEIFGFRQHGESEFVISNMPEDIKIFQAANLEARKMLDSNLKSDIEIKKGILSKIEKTSKFICFN